jgi:hypothetical protein
MAHRRSRRVRQSRHTLALQAFMALSLGPADSQVDVLRPIYLEHRQRFGSDSWCTKFFDQGIDDRTGEPQVVTDADLPGTPEYLARVMPTGKDRL